MGEVKDEIWGLKSSLWLQVENGFEAGWTEEDSGNQKREDVWWVEMVGMRRGQLRKSPAPLPQDWIPARGARWLWRRGDVTPEDHT